MEQNTIGPQVGLPTDTQTQKIPTIGIPNETNVSIGPITPEVPGTIETPTSSEGTETSKKKPNPIILISILLLIISIVVIATLLLKNMSKSNPSDTLPTSSPTPLATNFSKKTPTPVSIEGWKIYTNNVLKYQIRYPSDWSLDTSKAELPTNGNNIQEISLYKGTYKLTIAWPTAYGPTICYFDDQSSGQALSGVNYCRGEYVEYDGNGGLITYRRLLTPSLRDKIQTWTIFSKSKDYFVGLPPITMLAPESYSEDEISIMDKIVSTLTYLESYPYFVDSQTATPSGSN